MAVVGLGQGVNEGEVNDLGDAAQEVVLGDETVEGEPLVKLGRDVQRPLVCIRKEPGGGPGLLPKQAGKSQL